MKETACHPDSSFASTKIEDMQYVIHAEQRVDAVADAQRIRRMLARWIAQQIVRQQGEVRS